MKYSIVSKDCELSKEVKDKLIEKFGLYSYSENNPDVCFTIGGDGTYLKAVHQYMDSLENITFINIRTGTLGFYSNLDIEDMKNLDKIVEEQNDYVYHDLIEFSIDDGKTYYAVNEIALYGVPEALKVQIAIDGVKLEDFTGTGLVISTPTGSTGLNKSLNGAMIDEKIKALQLTEIAGIRNSIFKSIGNSVVLDSSRTVEISLKEKSDHLMISYDNESIKLENFNKIQIKYSDKKVKDLKYNNKDFFERVQKSFL